MGKNRNLIAKYGKWNRSMSEVAVIDTICGEYSIAIYFAGKKVATEFVGKFSDMRRDATDRVDNLVVFEIGFS